MPISSLYALIAVTSCCGLLVVIAVVAGCRLYVRNKRNQVGDEVAVSKRSKRASRSRGVKAATTPVAAQRGVDTRQVRVGSQRAKRSINTHSEAVAPLGDPIVVDWSGYEKKAQRASSVHVVQGRLGPSPWRV